MNDIQQLWYDNHSFRHCDGDHQNNMIEEYLLFLLRQPLPPSDFPIQSSFEDPFDDPKMEPLPFQKDNSKVSRSHRSSQDQSDTDLGQNKMSFTGDTIRLVAGGKRDDQYVFSQHDDDEEVASLTSSEHQEYRPHVAESVARFRPYQDKKWQGSFQRLLKFKNEFGHCCVPNSYTKDVALARWVKRQRHQYRKLEENDPTSTLTTSRLEKLESVGFVWHTHAVAWLEKMNELKEYKHKTGHCNVPSSYPGNSALSTWVKSQRRQYKLRVSGLQSTMTMDRIRVLRALEFVFEPRLTVI